ncbi:MAG: SRPBCC family protein [Candidatus Kapaibacterium sp.]
MKILKRLLIAILGFIALFLIIAIFVKKEYVVKRDIVINKPKQDVFNYIKFLKNQNEYSKWSKMDANMKKEFKGTDATIGFISSWDSENKDVGKGEQEIVKITEGSRVDYEIRFKIPFESTSNAYMSTEENGPNQTKVTWEFNGKMNYPMNLMLLFMDMDKEIGSDLNIGLNNLKGIQENYN